MMSPCLTSTPGLIESGISERCEYDVSKPSCWMRMWLPKPETGPAISILPSAAARTGEPIGAPKSIPACSRRMCRIGWNRIPNSDVTGAPLIGARMPPTLAAPLLPRLSTRRARPRLGRRRLALRLGIEAAEPPVAFLERIAVDVERAAVQADIDDPARRSRLVAKVALEEDADGLVGLKRRLQVGRVRRQAGSPRG